MKKTLIIILGLLLCQFSSLPQSGFKKHPYLIFRGTNYNMRVVWQMYESATCQIFWGTDTTYNLGSFNTSEYGDDHQHGYTISGLDPGTKYFYKVVAGTEEHNGFFNTAPPDDATGLKFFVYGDTREVATKHDLISGAIIGEYENDTGYQTITLCTGDLVQYGAVESNWQNQFFNPVHTNIRRRMAELPFISCLGNHELYLSGYANIDLQTTHFGKYFPYPYVERRYWSFDYGPMHVTIIDQYPGYYTLSGFEGFIDAGQLQWIEEDLSSTEKTWKVIILHEPGWSCEASSSGIAHPNNPDVQNQLQPLLEEYGVQVLFSAHNHYYARACKNGVYHITTAGGGAPLYVIEDDFPNIIYTRRTHHYCMVEIDGDTMTVRAKDLAGEVIDEFIVEKEVRPGHLLGFLTKEEGPGHISDIAVTAGGQVRNVDSTGYYGLRLDPGEHEVIFTLENYFDIYDSAIVFQGTETEYDTMMQFIPNPGIPSMLYPGNQLSVSPNPVSDYAVIRFEMSSHKTATLGLYSTTGVCLTEKLIDLQAAESEGTVIDMRGIPSGIYFIRLHAGEAVVTRKVIKF